MPIYPALGEEDLKRVIEVLKQETGIFPEVKKMKKLAKRL